ncbi:hypothetical protein K466DRAFT_584982 [Polyporus arcularius HHB13444]|uniref:BTB domain-containing protein n=1 Tax=Polyporus arcularius HHB13444 TaxID=1314778 RepID=A0A5C3PH12_9APHY|nr:hypothetical protein K466DRAFT_584982 [Polyporus arcularius HHB13444]
MPSQDTIGDGRRDVAVQTHPEPVVERDFEENDTRITTSDPKRDEELWFEDGDLAIVAGAVEFRVYQEPLFVHSPILCEMLSTGPTKSQLTVPLHVGDADCVTLRLSDPSDDVRHFLRGFFAGDTLRVGMIHPTYDELSAQIRLGHKYGVKQMVQSSVDYLQEYFPETTSGLTKWDIKHRFMPPGFALHHAIGVVNLARLVGAQSLLPAAMMACASVGRELTKGFARPDGSRETLASADLTRCITGRAAWTMAAATASHKVFKRTISKDCKRRAQCKPVFDKILERLADAENALFDVTFRTPSAWTSHVDSSDTDRVLCPKCYALIGVWDSGRQVRQAQELLCRIPEIFGVPAGAVESHHTEELVQVSADAS